MPLKKRIGVIMYQTSNSKGQELIAQRMVREFVKLGHAAFLITSNYHDGVKVVSQASLAKCGGYMYTERDHELGIPMIRVSGYVTRWPPRRINFRDFVSILEKIVDRFRLDILITHSTLWNGPEETAKFVEWRRHMKRIGGYLDPLVFCHMSHFQEPTAKRYSLTERSFRTAWNRLTLPQIFAVANLILVVTPFEKESKTRMGAKPESCFLYPGGVDEEEFENYSQSDAEIATDFLHKSNIDGSKKIITYLGSLEERKNPLAVLKIAELLKERKDIHFVIAGRAESAFGNRVIGGARDLPNVTYLGEISELQKIGLMKASRANIILSRSEALGLVQMEFLHSGVPVVTSGVEGQAWLVRDGTDGIHVKGSEDVEGAAKAITRLCDDEITWSFMSTNATKRTEDLTVSKLTEQLDSVLTEQLIKERGLTAMPLEVRETMAEPENVLKSWSSGSWGVIATRRRLFIRRGLISRKVTEMPYRNIISIEHMRRFPWRTVVEGCIISLLLYIVLFTTSNSAQPFGVTISKLLDSLTKNMAIQPALLSVLLILATLTPILISICLFLFETRTGFTLRSPGEETIYLPSRFREVITFIRNMQDVDSERSDTTRTRTSNAMHNFID